MGKASRKKLQQKKEDSALVTTLPEQIFLIQPLTAFFPLAILAFLIYSNTFSAPFVFDDIAIIVDNPQIRDLKNFANLSGTRYVGFLSFAVNYYFGRLTPLGYHLVNLTIHVVNAFLVYCLVLMFFRTPRMSSPENQLTRRASWWALATALLFVAHPIQTQAVTYVVQRFASLATLFYLLAVVCYLKWKLVLPQKRSRYLWYAGALLSTVLAMKTKEISFTLPIMLVLVEAIFFQGSAMGRWTALTPFLLTLLVIPLSRVDIRSGPMESGFAQQTSQISRVDYLITEFRVIISYLKLLIFPINQNLDYDYAIAHSIFEPFLFLSFLFLFVSFSLSVYVLFFLPQISSAVRWMAFGILWFFLTLSIESSIIPIEDVIFEHRLYLPSVGFFMMCLAGLKLGKRWLRKRPLPLGSSTVGLGIVILVFSIATYQRNKVWESDLTLWQDVVSKSPTKARGYANLGLSYANRDNWEGAIQQYKKALELTPDFPEALNNLGAAYAHLGRWEEAIPVYQRAVELKPGYALAHNNLGIAYYTGRRQSKEAIEEYQKALSIHPDNADAHNNLGLAYAVQGRLEEAIQSYRRALTLQQEIMQSSDAPILSSNLAVIYTNLGKAYAAHRRLIEAREALKLALDLNPNSIDARQVLESISQK